MPPRRALDKCPTCDQFYKKPTPTKTCDRCGKEFNARGMGNHRAACPGEYDLDGLLAIGGVDTTVNGCWEWSLTPGQDYPSLNGERVSRRILALRHDEPMTGWTARHTCDNPPCVNPEHIVRGTQAENNRDTYERGRIDLEARGAAIKESWDKRREMIT